MIMNIIGFILQCFVLLIDIYFQSDRNTPMSKDKSPVTVYEIQELMKQLAKFIATQKGQNLQKTIPDAHALLGKWHELQRAYKNRIEHFLPRIGDHPDHTLRGVIMEWDTSAKASNIGKEVVVPVDFPPDIVLIYKTLNEEYVPSTPIRTDEPKHLLKLLPLDIRFMLGCGLKWDDNQIEPSASDDAAARSAPAPAASPAVVDRSPSPPAPADPLNIVSWDPAEIESIPFDRLVFAPDLAFTNNRTYHAVAILFFLHPELPNKYPQLKDALHAGWTTTFKHPMNFEELRRPPCVGEGAYTDEEQEWCTATITYLVSCLDTAGRQSRGIPESAVARRTPQRRAAAAAAAPAAAAPAAAAPAAAGPGPAAAAAQGRGGGGGAGGQRGRGRGRGGSRTSEDLDDAPDGRNNTDTEDENVETTQSNRRKRGKSQSRYHHFCKIVVLFAVMVYLFYL
jgi:hypothetical protein